MARPQKYNHLLKEDIKPINEIFDSFIETDYKIIEYSGYIVFQFQTKNGNSYDLEFYNVVEKLDTQLESGKTLSKYFPDNVGDFIEALDIAFTYSEIQNKDNEDDYEKDLNRNEQSEIFGRISYILKKELFRTKNELFIVGGARRNRSDIYYNIFNNNFRDVFHLEYGQSFNHPNSKSMFLIKK